MRKAVALAVTTPSTAGNNVRLSGGAQSATCESADAHPAGFLRILLIAPGITAKQEDGGRRCKEPQTKVTALETIFKLLYYT